MTLVSELIVYRRLFVCLIASMLLFKAVLEVRKH